MELDVVTSRAENDPLVFTITEVESTYSAFTFKMLQGPHKLP